MAQAAVGLDIRQAEPAITIIDIEGDVTPASEEALMGAYGHAGGARAVILNFSGLDYMNSGGIGLLVTLLVRAQRQKQRLLAYGLTDHYRQIFELTRLDDAIGIHDDEAAALAAAGAAPAQEQETVR
jgi:anti-sigma B factor antagonist